MDEKELKELLTKENLEFKEVYELHQQCENELEKLNQKNFISEKERLDEKALKKKKLRLKDRMYYLMEHYRKSLE
jgi:hypothetical protein